MKNNDFVPPLRLILNSKCNGNCRFCHGEGNEAKEEMPESLIYECVRTAEFLSIPYIALTGGEPTLREDLSDIIKGIQTKYKGVKIGLTSNGYKLKEVGERLVNPIYNLNLSIASFKEDIAKKYQNVIPKNALASFEDFPAKHKNLNVMLLMDNFSEIDNMIEYCSQKGVSIDIMFQTYRDKAFEEIQKETINKLIALGECSINLKSTPVLKIKLKENIDINVKHPYLNTIFHSRMCATCDERYECFEKVCAVRVHPNGGITPCLSLKQNIKYGEIFDTIQHIYGQLGDMIIMQDYYEKKDC